MLLADSRHRWLPVSDAQPADPPGPPIEARASSGEPGPDGSGAVDNAAVRRIQDLPKEVGVMLASVGVLGVVLPGVMGAPALIAGGLVLWPGAFGGLDRWFQRRNPDLHRRAMKQIGRFLDDLERRYPDLTRGDERVSESIPNLSGGSST
jgi:hypothetical protein